ncbi:MAG TPA: hypothetical protein VG096_14450 [Bryobacteraceae bacterium]|jgi:Flp pilus assembly pilin Flp|nr:hypothetical protein [Bryobacteraceae bacterium]
MKPILRNFLAAKNGLDLIQYSLLIGFVALVSYFYGSMWEFYRHLGHLQ